MKHIELRHTDNSKSKSLAELISSNRRLWEFTGNACLALWSLGFFISLLVDFKLHHRVSSLLMVIFDGALVWFSVMRPMPKTVNVSLYDWTVSFTCSFVIFLMRPAPQVHDSAILLGMQLLGTCISLAGLFSLNKSFGVVPANRGIKTMGMYRVVRHPIYAGYVLTTGAFMVQNLTVVNTLVYAAIVILLTMRVVAEERVLLGDLAYCEYAAKIRWRVIPGVF
jgi:protein-S-isoprenylcysteine O-methyltransferase Ste14